MSVIKVRYVVIRLVIQHHTEKFHLNLSKIVEDLQQYRRKSKSNKSNGIELMLENCNLSTKDNDIFTMQCSPSVISITNPPRSAYRF